MTARAGRARNARVGGAVVRLRAASAFLALLAGLLASVVTAGPAAAEVLSAAGERTFADLAACASGADHVLTAIVVDESSSLQDTDDANLRVGAIVAAVDALDAVQQQAAESNRAVTVEASLAVFGRSYTELVPWGVVEDGHTDALLAAAQRELPGRNRADYTDYRAALREAQGSIDARAATLGGTTCSMILWFTDGELDVPGTGEDGAWRELCDPLGMVDGVRSSGTAIVAVALFTEGGRRTVPQEKREQVRAVAEGTGTGTSCGTVPIPAGAQGGAYLQADDPGALRRLFAGIGARIGGANGPTGVACPGETCPDGALAIPLDRGVEGFRAILDAAEASAPMRLVAPDGDQLDLAPGAATLAGADVLVTARDGLTVVSVTRAGGAPESGVWTLETGASDAAPVDADVYYFWGISLAVAAPDGLLIGETSSVDVLARFSDGSPVDPEAYGSFDLRLEANGVPLPVTWHGPGRAGAEITLPDDGAAPAVAVAAVASATGAPSGSLLGPVTVTAEIPTALPPAFPRLDTTSLTFPALVRATSATSALQLTGSDRGPTRACLEGQRLAGPARAGDLGLVAATCVDIPAGAPVVWPFELEVSDTADGRVEGAVTVRLVAVDEADTRTVDVPVSAVLSRPVDQGKRLLLLAVLIALAVLIPLVIGWVGNALVARYVVGPRTRVARIPVDLSGEGLTRSGAGRPPGAGFVEADDVGFLGQGSDQRVRGFAAAGLVFGRTLPANPFREPQAWVQRADGTPLVASTDPREHCGADGTRARIGFGLGSTLYLSLRPSGPGRFSGDLVVVATDTSGLSAIVGATNEQVARSGRTWEAIREALGAVAVEVPTPQGAVVPPPPPGAPRPPGPPGPEERDDRPPQGSGIWGGAAGSAPSASASAAPPAGGARPGGRGRLRRFFSGGRLRRFFSGGRPAGTAPGGAAPPPVEPDPPREQGGPPPPSIFDRR